MRDGSGIDFGAKGRADEAGLGGLLGNGALAVDGACGTRAGKD